ncbi:SubName: Full=Uncharacterized protein {ECO:0000313/EMBL:CCA73102.1} [Serendipita indica DSM 11827]|nr:SubName: Full=Uncharacterized protein {ECO:0000313/EMBL:CCA73102.1} [Serendipita indica DSM 11827]
MSAAAISQFVEISHDLYLSRLLAGVSATLVVYDWLLMFDTETATIYQSKWTAPKALFVFIRAITPPGILLSAFQFSDLRPALSARLYVLCMIWAIVGVLAMFLSLTAANALLTLRLIALYRRNKKMVWFVTGFFLVTYITTGVIVIVSLYIYHSTIFYSTMFQTCGSMSSSKLMPAMFYAPAGFETFIFVLTAYRAWRDARLLTGPGATPFLFVLYRDGFIFFFVMVAVRAWNIWIYLSQPLSSSSLGTLLMWALNTILTTRVYMNLVWLAKTPQLTVVTEPEVGHTTIGLNTLNRKRGQASTFGMETDADGIHTRGPSNLVLGNTRKARRD